jgi:hypothetical protein
LEHIAGLMVSSRQEANDSGVDALPRLANDISR